MSFEVGDLARLNITAVVESHNCKSGDMVRILRVFDDSGYTCYQVRHLTTGEDLKWLPMESQLKELHPLEQLGTVLRDDEIGDGNGKRREN